MRSPSPPETTRASTPPVRIASSVWAASWRCCSAAARRRRRSPTWRRSASRETGVRVFSDRLWPDGMADLSCAWVAKVQAQQHLRSVGHVADEPAEGQRQLLDQRGRRDDLLAGEQCRPLVDVDDLQLVQAVEVL